MQTHNTKQKRYLIKPLSPLKYFGANKKRTVGMTTALSAGIIGIIVFQIIGFAVIQSTMLLYLNLFDNMSAIYPGPNGSLAQSLVERIETDENVERTVNATVLNTNFYHFFGNIMTNIMVMENKDVDYFLAKHNIKLIDGRMPQAGKNEIALDYRAMKNRGFHVGDYIGKEVDISERIEGKYLITGSLSGDVVCGFGITDKPLLKTNGFLIFLKEGKRDRFNESVKNIDKNDAHVIPRVTALEEYNNTASGLKNLYSIVTFAILVVISFAVANTCYAQYFSRRNEFGMLMAIGYKRIDILKRAAGELVFINVLAFVSGVVLSY
ncbi:MAG: hypothetical protein BGN88_13320, partial [Clostridiales bacterium 43-6]